jgi:hypothetical protein
MLDTPTGRIKVLDIGHVRSGSGDSALTLATMGRTGDVIVEGSTIARIQCSFEIDRETNVVMFYDRSSSQTSQVFGENAVQFEHGRPRRVVVQDQLNTIIGMGGVKRNLVLFQLQWHYLPEQVTERVKGRDREHLEVNPRLSRTMDEAETVAPSRMET